MAKKTKESSEKKQSPKKIIKALGIDLSIGKVKLCLLGLEQDEKKISGGWTSLPVPFNQLAEKEFEFTEGMVRAIESFLQFHKTEVKEIKSIIFCTGGALYMFKTFIAGLHYIGGILKMVFPRQKIYFARCDGTFTGINDIFNLPDDQAAAYGCTNFLGTALLASKLFENGLAIDMGTISTSIIPIINGQIDPVASFNPSGYMLHRYNTGKHVWYGVMHTPLIYITHQARTKKARYNLILRSCSTNTLSSLLDLVPSEVANVHVSENSMLPSKELSLMQLAESIGADINSVPQSELFEIAGSVYYQALYKLTDYFMSILSNMNYKNFDDLKILTTGLGQDAFLIPLVKSCGFSNEQIIKIAENKEGNLWTAASVYGITLKALEEITGENISVNVENAD